jgi:hypothetical protein
MENKLPDLDFDEEKINFLLENTDKLQQILTKEEINSLVQSLKKNLSSIEEIISELQKLDSN